MRIGLQAYGTAGDIRPVIALAGGLRARGHVVMLAVTSADGADYSAVCERLDVNYISVTAPDAATRFRAFCHDSARQRNPFRQTRRLLEATFFPGMEQIYGASRQLAEACDLVIAHFLMYPLRIAAARRGIPCLGVILSPGMIPTSTHPPQGQFEIPNLGPWANRFIWRGVKWAIDRELKPRIDDLWVREGLTPPKHVLTGCWQSDALNLIAVDRLFLEPAPDWGERFPLCGFLRIPNEAEEWTIPEELRQFLDAGEPPVFLTSGSVAYGAAGNEADVVERAIELAGCRAIVHASPWDGREDGRTDRIFRIRTPPHQQIYPLCCAVVHHAGAQTSIGVAYAGLPSIPIPYLDEQAIWAKALHRLGVASEPVFRKAASAERLAAAIREALDSSAMAARSREVGRLLHARDGVRAAVDLIEGWASHGVAR
jgi:sterol 3beta-glucosyltransferase